MDVAQTHHVDAFESEAASLCRANTIANCRVEGSEAVVDFYFWGPHKPRPFTRAVTALLAALHRRKSLAAARITIDHDRPHRLTFVNVHLPLDRHIRRRLRVAGAIIAQWQEEQLGAL